MATVAPVAGLAGKLVVGAPAPALVSDAVVAAAAAAVEAVKVPATAGGSAAETTEVALGEDETSVQAVNFGAVQGTGDVSAVEGLVVAVGVGAKVPVEAVVVSGVGATAGRGAGAGAGAGAVGCAVEALALGEAPSEEGAAMKGGLPAAVAAGKCISCSRLARDRIHTTLRNFRAQNWSPQLKAIPHADLVDKNMEIKEQARAYV